MLRQVEPALALHPIAHLDEARRVVVVEERSVADGLQEDWHDGGRDDRERHQPGDEDRGDAAEAA